MTMIIGLSGKKQSGKSTACNFILGYILSNTRIVRGTFNITEEGKLQISDLFGDPEHDGIFDYFRQCKEMDEFKAAYIDKHIKIYSIADMLKREVSMNILGLTYEQVYGTDEQKNTLTNILWENLPGIVTTEKAAEILCDISGHGEHPKALEALLPIIVHDPGPMTAREVMQYIGTEVFRKMIPTCWVDSTIRKIKSEEPDISLICDVRFPDEVEAIQKAEGIVVRLTKNSSSTDAHHSETALDGYENFDVVLDNENVGIEEGNQQIYSLLSSIGLVQESK